MTTANRKQIQKGLDEIGACWAIRTDKFVSPDDPMEDQYSKRKTYHIHPDQTYPHGDYIQRFDTLAEIAEWIDDVRARIADPSLDDGWARR